MIDWPVKDTNTVQGPMINEYEFSQQICPLFCLETTISSYLYITESFLYSAMFKTT